MSDDLQVVEVTLRVRSIGVKPAANLSAAVQMLCATHPSLFVMDASSKRPSEAVPRNSTIGKELARRAHPLGPAATEDDVVGLVALLGEQLFGEDDARGLVDGIRRELGYMPASLAGVLSRWADATPGEAAA